MSDVITLVRDYLDAVRKPVTADEIVTHRATPLPHDRRVRRGPLVALIAALVVLAGGLAMVLLQSGETEVVNQLVVDDVIAGREENSNYAVGFDTDGGLCAEAGASVRNLARREATGVCGDSDQLAAAAFQGDDAVALAGWIPTSAAKVAVAYDGDVPRPLQLVSIPGYELYAFGAIETIHAEFIEVQVMDATGEILQPYFPSIEDATD